METDVRAVCPFSEKLPIGEMCLLTDCEEVTWNSKPWQLLLEIVVFLKTLPKNIQKLLLKKVTVKIDDHMHTTKTHSPQKLDCCSWGLFSHIQSRIFWHITWSRILDVLIRRCLKDLSLPGTTGLFSLSFRFLRMLHNIGSFHWWHSDNIIFFLLVFLRHVLKHVILLPQPTECWAYWVCITAPGSLYF